MAEQEPPDPETELNLRISEDMFGGVWSNLARVTHSPFEFTIDFCRAEFGQNPTQAVVQARVNMSPLMVSQLIDALQLNWQSYAKNAMPPEVYDDGDAGQQPSS